MTPPTAGGEYAHFAGEAARLYLQGHTIAEVQGAVGLGEWKVRQLLIDAGIHRRRPGSRTQGVRERLYAGMKTGPGCWEWGRGRDKRGYGHMSRPERGASRLVHRVSWEVHRGPIPGGMCVLHQCDNPPCCNPDHLFLGTRGDNNKDMRRKGRGARGERHANAKLTDAAVMSILRRRTQGSTQAELAEEHGVSRATIGYIVTGKSWRHITLGGAQ